MDLSTSVKELRLKEITNITYKICRTLDVPLIVEVDMSKKIISKKIAENQQLVVNELMERTQNIYWKIEEKGDDEQMGIFLEELKSRLDSILNNVKLK
ncbi:hypothetical protein Glove_334g13 [Diversispora epigaea]|uniref:Uncharacterized protein n=1 Tax=Diversispora epigaea TaxID=1348612 RepID=A0A397HIH5_9GLOM|nr:hypothetical protein Glove_334g13 [Diversispora epigaea]